MANHFHKSILFRLKHRIIADKHHQTKLTSCAAPLSASFSQNKKGVNCFQLPLRHIQRRLSWQPWPDSRAVSVGHLEQINYPALFYILQIYMYTHDFTILYKHIKQHNQATRIKYLITVVNQASKLFCGIVFSGDIKFASKEFVSASDCTIDKFYITQTT